MLLDRSAALPKASAEYTLRDQERMRLARNYFQWQASMVEPYIGRRVLEVGCGLGNFTRYLLNRELVVGIDVQSECVDSWRASFPGATNLVGFALDVADNAFLDLKKYAPDSVVCLNVLEHIQDDGRALEHMYAVLPPGGRALLIVPAFESLYGPIDWSLGHFRRYSREQFQRLSESIGFRPVIRYFNMAGWLGWWLNARVFKKTEQSPTQIRLFDAAVVPLMSRLEALAPPPFGQSLFAVLEKPAAQN